MPFQTQHISSPCGRGVLRVIFLRRRNNENMLTNMSSSVLSANVARLQYVSTQRNAATPLYVKLRYVSTKSSFYVMHPKRHNTCIKALVETMGTIFACEYMKLILETIIFCSILLAYYNLQHSKSLLIGMLCNQSPRSLFE